MFFEAGEFYHLYNKGNNKRIIFFNEENYLFFLMKVKTQLCPVSDIIAYCLMPNHFHFLLQPTLNGLTSRRTFRGKSMQELAYRVGIMFSSYSQATNKQNNTIGSLFQQKTKSKILRETDNSSQLSYFEQCFHYIHQNPLAAGLVNDLAAWPYSSYPDYVGIRNGTLCKKEIFYSLTGMSQDDIIKKTIGRFDEQILDKIF